MLGRQSVKFSDVLNHSLMVDSKKEMGERGGGGLEQFPVYPIEPARCALHMTLYG